MDSTNRFKKELLCLDLRRPLIEIDDSYHTIDNGEFLSCAQDLVSLGNCLNSFTALAHLLCFFDDSEFLNETKKGFDYYQTEL